MKKPIILLILDGWGFNKNIENNSIKLANIPNYDRIIKTYPNVKLNASGNYVGLPKGQIGNSEVGHLNIGSGRIINQDLTNINNYIKNKSFFDNKVLKKIMKNNAKKEKTIHLLGLLSDGGVHSHIDHIKALIKMAKNFKVKKIFLHAILDGRDVPPKSSKKYIIEIERYFKKIGLGSIATITGRFYLMDRDKNFDRLQIGYQAITEGIGIKENNALDAIKKAYERGETDEFISPIIIKKNNKINIIKNEDTLIFFNFRSDRMREIFKVFTDYKYNSFEHKIVDVNCICFTEYNEKIKKNIVFPQKKIINTLGEILSKKGFKQIRIAETEKYAHVTFFFNGGIEKASKGEDRILIASKKIKTYDLIPEMSLKKIVNTSLKILDLDKYDLLIINFANGDMVGHTGNLKASIKSVEEIDKALYLLEKKILMKNGVFLITSDHGNCETMFNIKTKEIITAHTSNKVPFILISNKKKKYKLRNDFNLSLCDIAPTILNLLKQNIPKEMTGKSILLNDIKEENN